MVSLPWYAEEALYRLDYPREIRQATFEAFVNRWGGADEGDLVKAATGDVGEDRLIALYMLEEGQFRASCARLVPLLPDLHGADLQALAICLAALGDHRAYPILADLLIRDFPLAQDYCDDRAEQYYYELGRIRMADLLGETGESRYAPALRSALGAYIALERDLILLRGHMNWDTSLITLHLAETSLVYALGRLGTFGALAGLNLTGLGDTNGPVDPETRLHMWCAHLVMGSLHGHYPAPPVGTRASALGHVVDQLEGLLQSRFGWSQAETRRSVEYYQRRMFMATVQTYRKSTERTEEKRRRRGG